MRTTKEEIRGWFEQGVEYRAVNMLVVCDTFSYEDYPVYILPDQDLNSAIDQYSNHMQRVMECYDLRADKEEQLTERRVWRV